MQYALGSASEVLSPVHNLPDWLEKVADCYLVTGYYHTTIIIHKRHHITNLPFCRFERVNPNPNLKLATKFRCDLLQPVYSQIRENLKLATKFRCT